MGDRGTRAHKCIHLAIAIALVLVAPSALAARPHSPKKLVNDGAVLLDVRSEAEFKTRHIDGAINIPLPDLPYFLEELGSKDRPVVVYCQSGGRSKEAARLLRHVGFRTVVDLGAMQRWYSRRG